MQRLIEGIVSYMQGNATLNAFSGVNGNSSGPFYDIAPENTTFPYVVINVVPGRQLLQGYSTKYVAPSEIQFTVRGTDLLTVGTNTETLCKFFDTISSLTLSGVELTRKPIRFQDPNYVSEPITTDGKRVYAGIIDYVFMVQRTKGQV